ncbi:MAG: hypothetical protein KDA91_10680, partial [Planctomycetaceae bacterium]|nr:hypothetical protein [Planctomycetaceae bacterium]
NSVEFNRVEVGVHVDFFNLMKLTTYSTSVSQQLEKDLSSDSAFVGAISGTVQVVASGLSVGYVIWALRGGMVLTGLLAQMPTWRLIDPLMVFENSETEDDNDSLQSIIRDQEALISEQSKRNDVTESQL